MRRNFFFKNCLFPVGDRVPYLTHGTYGLPESSSQNGISIGSAVFVWVLNTVLYNALSVGKKTPKTVPSP